MPTVQELLTELRQHTEQAPTAEQLQAVVHAVYDVEELLVAFFPATKHYFITKELDEPTAVIFSNRDSFERFAERCKEQGEYTEAIVNARADRKMLFMDLLRCGFTRVLIDYAPVFIVLPVTEFAKMPDMSKVPLIMRPFPAPVLTGKILYLFQQIHSRKADGELELDVLRELYHSPLLMPVQAFTADGKTAYNVPAQEQGGKRTAHLFTDHIEWDHFGVSGEYVPAIARFPEMQRILQSGFDQLIVNPGSGAELVLDAALLAAAEQAVMGEEEISTRSMQERGEKLTVSTPAEDTSALTAAMTAILAQQPNIEAAYLRLLKRENTLHPSWLVLLEASDDRGRKALYKTLSAAAQPFLGSNSIEFADYREARELAGNAKPFYKKKRGLFRK